MKDFKIQADSTYFVDTNIWLYAFIQYQGTAKNEIAKDIIKECDIVISTQIITQIINEICVNLIKKAKFPEEKIQNLISSLFKRYTVFESSRDVLLKASQIRDVHSFSFWDSIVAASALDCDADCLITEDMQDGFILEKKLKIINPFT